jgi:hypothetical protein
MIPFRTTLALPTLSFLFMMTPPPPKGRPRGGLMTGIKYISQPIYRTARIFSYSLIEHPISSESRRRTNGFSCVVNDNDEYRI